MVISFEDDDKTSGPYGNSCTNCGEEIQPGSKFCTNCGTAVKSQHVSPKKTIEVNQMAVGIIAGSMQNTLKSIMRKAGVDKEAFKVAINYVIDNL